MITSLNLANRSQPVKFTAQSQSGSSQPIDPKVELEAKNIVDTLRSPLPEEFKEEARDRFIAGSTELKDACNQIAEEYDKKEEEAKRNLNTFA